MAQAAAVLRAPVGEPPIAQLLFADPRLAWFWLLVRLYAGYQWVAAGMEKLGNPAWTGSKAGTAIAGFVAGALPKAAGAHPDVAGWYAGFLQAFVLPHAALWSWLIVFGEIAVGVGLILGLFTGIAAFFGGLLNANYLLAGTVSTNPMLFILATWLVLAWRVAGYYGLDYWVLPAVGVPGGTGGVFRGRHRVVAPSVPDRSQPHPI
jgi:thiosulfate dehydrogenase [quinone] large subunit